MGTINRLYQELALRMQALKADFSFYPLNSSTDPADFERECSRASVLMPGVLTADRNLNRRVLEILKQQKQ